MPEENQVEGLASRSVQELSQKQLARMRSDKADISSAIVIQMLYSTCILETGIVEVFDLICNIISSVCTE